MTDQIDSAPRDPDEARAQIEQTRARMSETLDEIEDVLLRKREQLRETLDVRARIRERPLHVAGLVLGAGLLLGFLTGGGGDRRPRRRPDERATLWEARARRLLAIARDQEREIDELEDALAELAVRRDEDAREEWDDLEDEEVEEVESPSRFVELKEAAASRLGALAEDVVGAVAQAMSRRA